MLSTKDVKRLAELLKTEDHESDSDDDLPRSGLARLGPGDVGPTKKQTGSSTAGDKKKSTDVKAVDGRGDAEICLDQKAIWSDDEVVEVDDMEDPREEPRYHFSYRQDVGAEDVYLQLGSRTPATASCEWLVLEVWLEGERRCDVDVSLQPQRLELRSPRYRLSLALPQPVLPDSSAATWDPDNCVLKLRMRMSRELDFVNF
ncbi:dynein axonemal assembly factor 6 [Schistocerca cancellata]|uniref:dynein axonemal assembly factor 6 n=1 Tax=Schistocerca cancellata TaxID=274614 RepID=UPI002118DAEE|nr:dynein axonemal assembly factor 6 [Schistocerca cancellata]